MLEQHVRCATSDLSSDVVVKISPAQVQMHAHNLRVCVRACVRVCVCVTVFLIDLIIQELGIRRESTHTHV